MYILYIYATHVTDKLSGCLIGQVFVEMPGWMVDESAKGVILRTQNDISTFQRNMETCEIRTTFQLYIYLYISVDIYFYLRVYVYALSIFVEATLHMYNGICKYMSLATLHSSSARLRWRVKVR